MTTYHHFDPRQYLNDYYADLPPENRAMLTFLVESFDDVPDDALALDFGAGPMLYTAIAGAAAVGEMHLAEYLPANRAELKRWLDGHPDAFDWSPAIRTVLSLQDIAPLPAAIRDHEALIRQRVTRVMPCDLSQPDPLNDSSLSGCYDVLVSNLCAEAVAPDLATWNAYLGKFAALLKPGGRLILTAVKQSRSYSVGSYVFPVLPLSEEDVAYGLNLAGFAQMTPMNHAPADDPNHPYEGLIFAVARKL